MLRKLGPVSRLFQFPFFQGTHKDMANKEMATQLLDRSSVSTTHSTAEAELVKVIYLKCPLCNTTASRSERCLEYELSWSIDKISQAKGCVLIYADPYCNLWYLSPMPQEGGGVAINKE